MTEVATITIGAVNYSVYGVTSDALSDANNYFAASLGAAEWTAASTTTKQQALVTAFRAIERELWSGTKLDPAQTTEWGRTGATKNGVVVDDGIPLDIVYGQFEMALYFLKDASNVSKPNTASNVKSVKAGSAQVNFFYPLPGSTLRWPKQIQDLLAGYLAGANGSILAPYASGTEETVFEREDFGRSEGFA